MSLDIPDFQKDGVASAVDPLTEERSHELVGRYRTRNGGVAVVEGYAQHKAWPLYGYVERWVQRRDLEWRLIQQRERWQADGTWGEKEPFELDLMLGETA